MADDAARILFVGPGERIGPWPKDVRGWYADAAGFLTELKQSPRMWMELAQGKYLNMRIDTRDGAFYLSDRDGVPLDADKVIEAARTAKIRWGG